MRVIQLECADLTAAIDLDLGAGLLGVWRRDTDGRRRPLIPPAPFPKTSTEELIAAWRPETFTQPVRIEHRTPLSVSWRWPEGQPGRWELTPSSLVAKGPGPARVETLFGPSPLVAVTPHDHGVELSFPEPSEPTA